DVYARCVVVVVFIILNLALFYVSTRRRLARRDFHAQGDPPGQDPEGPVRLRPQESRVSFAGVVPRSPPLDHPRRLPSSVPRETRADHLCDGRRRQAVLPPVPPGPGGGPPRAPGPRTQK